MKAAHRSSRFILGLGLLLGLGFTTPEAHANGPCQDARYTFLEFEELGPSQVDLNESLKGFTQCFQNDGPHQRLYDSAPYRLDFARALYAKRDYDGAISQANLLIAEGSQGESTSTSILVSAHIIASQALTHTRTQGPLIAADEARAHIDAALALSRSLPPTSDLPMRAKAWSHRLRILNGATEADGYQALGNTTTEALTSKDGRPALKTPSDLPGVLRGLLWMSGDPSQRARCDALLPKESQGTPELACQRLALTLMDGTSDPTAFDPVMERYIHRSLYRVALDRGDIDPETFTAALHYWKGTLETALKVEGQSAGDAPNLPLIDDRLRAATYLARPLLLDEGPRGHEARRLFAVDTPAQAAQLVLGWLERRAPSPGAGDALATSRLVTLALSYTLVATGGDTPDSRAVAKARARAYLDQLPNYGDPFFRAHYHKGATTLDPSEVALMQWSRVQLDAMSQEEGAAADSQASLLALVQGEDSAYLQQRLWYPTLALAMGPNQHK